MKSNSFLIIGMFTASIFLLTACKDEERKVDPYYFLQPQIPLVKDFPLDKAGVKISQDFWVLPEASSKTMRPVFIGLRVAVPKSTEVAEIIRIDDFLAAADMPVRITLAKLDGSQEKSVKLSEYYFSPNTGPNPKRIMSSAVALGRQITSADLDLMTQKNHINANLRYTEFQFAHMQRPDPGQYRLELEVLEDNPAAAGMKTELLVSNYHRGK